MSLYKISQLKLRHVIFSVADGVLLLSEHIHVKVKFLKH